MPGYGFCFRASTRKEGGAGRLYLRVVHGGQSRSVTTGYRILPEEWDAAGRRLVIPYGDSVRRLRLIEIENSMLNDLRRMGAVIRELEKGGHYTIDRLMELYRSVMRGNAFRTFAENPAADMAETCRTAGPALTVRELAILSLLDPTSEHRAKHRVLPDHLGQALAMFLFCCHARGMCFIDMANLKKGDLRGETIRYRRPKTGQTIELRVLPAMRRIIDWFAPHTADSIYLFPVIADPGKDIALQYASGLRLQNQRLKKIAALCGIDKRLSTHSARRSWATATRSMDFSPAVVDSFS